MSGAKPTDKARAENYRKSQLVAGGSGHAYQRILQSSRVHHKSPHTFHTGLTRVYHHICELLRRLKTIGP